MKFIIFALVGLLGADAFGATRVCRARRGQEFYSDYCRSQSIQMCPHNGNKCRVVIIGKPRGQCVAKRDSFYDSYCGGQSRQMCEHSEQCRWVRGYDE